MSRFIISCGGSGGHLAPGIALAEELSARGHRCRLLISRKEVDSRLTREGAGISYVRVPGVPFSMRPARLFDFLLTQVRLLLFAIRFFRQERPDLVIAFGGFVTSGIVLSAFLIGCPLALHEANRRPGKAIRVFRSLADRIYLPDGIRLAGVAPKTMKYYGYPLRREICAVGRIEARKCLNIDIKGKLIAVIGGSQGAEVLNYWVLEHWELLASEGINIYCVTGLGKGVESKVEIKGPGSVSIFCHFTPFTDDMSAVLCSADLVVSRAGAGAMAEIVHCGVPSILVPYPHASNDHQMVNARFLEQHGGTVVLDQDRIEELQDEVLDLIFNDWLLRKFRNNLQKVQRGVSAERIASDLEELATHSHEVNLQRRGGRLQILA